MNTPKRQELAIQVLLLLEPSWVHDDKCPGVKNPAACNCYQLVNTKARVVALDDAGLLRSTIEE